MIRQMTAIIEREGESYVALCPRTGHCESRRKRVGGSGQSKGSALNSSTRPHLLTKSNGGFMMKSM